MTTLGIYLIGINILTFLIYGVDKWKARKDRWRIPEDTLIWLAIVGGSIGALLAMYLFRHKIRDRKFTLGVPAILAVQISVYYVYSRYIITATHQAKVPPPRGGVSGGGNVSEDGCYAPSVATITALMVCIRFSASSKTMLAGLSNTSSVTSTPFRPNFWKTSSPTLVSRLW